ncbi:MAG: FAD-dependent thymidylate synthase [Patescibacteria group bacterium]
MNSGRGVFVVIEGTDGSGKGTQFKRLADRLAQEGYDVASFDFPQYELPSSYFVRQYLNGEYGTAEAVGPYTGSLFYALDRFEAAPKIREALEQGKVVLANRYVGSNMAHQGTKFRHAEERRGYFIWLDNLEFEILKLPRPTTSFVLRVPVEIAQSLVDQKGGRQYTDKKRDLYEADLEHLQKAVTVYDDMCQLFPKDFSRIDCTRDGKLLDIDTIHSILWQKIEPMLPAKKMNRGKSVAAAVDPPAITDAPRVEPPRQEQPSHTSAQPPDMQFSLPRVSSLTAKKVEWGHLASFVEQADDNTAYEKKNEQGHYDYYVPPYFDAQLQEKYRAHMDQVFNLYSEMAGQLIEHLKNGGGAATLTQDAGWLSGLRLQATETVRAVLPVAAMAAIGIQGSAQALECVIVHLLSDALPEAYEAGKILLAEGRKTSPTFMEDIDLTGDVTYHTNNHKRLDALAKKYLPDQYADHQPAVQLTGMWPRNELDLIPDMLYEHSNLTIKELERLSSAWPYERKLEVFEAYIGQRLHRNQCPGRALEKAHYSWDVVSEFDTFRDLQRNRKVDDLGWQELTPRYGYKVPALIEEADLTDQFEACFDLSLRLHSIIQEAGYIQEAQYATLQGHTMRWKVTYNAREAFQLHELRSGPHNRQGVRKLVLAMHEKLREKHPLLGEAMKFIGEDTA